MLRLAQDDPEEEELRRKKKLSPEEALEQDIAAWAIASNQFSGAKVRLQPGFRRVSWQDRPFCPLKARKEAGRLVNVAPGDLENHSL